MGLADDLYVSDSWQGERGNGNLCATGWSPMAVLLIARFDGDIEHLVAAYDEAHELMRAACRACNAPTNRR